MNDIKVPIQLYYTCAVSQMNQKPKRALRELPKI